MQKTEKRFYTCGQLAIRWGCSIPEVVNFLDRVSEIDHHYIENYPNHTGTLLTYPESEIHEFEKFYFTLHDLPSTTIRTEVLSDDPSSQEGVKENGEPYTYLQETVDNLVAEIRHLEKELSKYGYSEIINNTSQQEKLSSVALSNLYTMAIASQIDPRQAVPTIPGLPSPEIRRLRAQLILEEVFETVEALGFVVCTRVFDPDYLVHRTLDTRGLTLVETDSTLNFEKAIDGCIDTIYVCVGTLMSMGVPDLPFSQEVCRANEAKFPDGKPVVNDAGKFQKPDGWNPPDIAGVMQENANLNLNEVAIEITRDYNRDI